MPRLNVFAVTAIILGGLASSSRAHLDLKELKEKGFYKYTVSQSQRDNDNDSPAYAVYHTQSRAEVEMKTTPLLACPWGLTQRVYHPGYKCEMLSVGGSGVVSETGEFLKSSFTGTIGIGTPPQVMSEGSTTLSTVRSFIHSSFLTVNSFTLDSLSTWCLTPGRPTCGCRASPAKTRGSRTQLASERR